MKSTILLKTCYTPLACLFLLLAYSSLFGQTEPNNPITYDTTISETANGEGPFTWQVRVTRQQNDITPRPAFISMPGSGETGTDVGNLVLFGPHYWLNNGWDGSVKLGNGTHYPILITIEQPSQNMRPWHLRAVMDILLSTFPIKSGSVHVAGLSQGSYEWGELIGFAAFAGDESSMSLIRSWVDLEGVGPGDNFLGFDQPFPKPYATWASKYGGTFFGLEGTQDSRNIWQISQAMNTANANSAYFSYENLGGGSHCCWDSMYDPSVTNWQDVGTITNPNLVPSTDPASTMGSYSVDPSTGTNIFQWMLRQGDTTLASGGVPPTSPPPILTIVGTQTITVPASTVTLKGTANARSGGASIHAVTWSQISGPNISRITTPTKFSTAVTGLTVGTYIFKMTIATNGDGSFYDSTNVIVKAESAVGTGTGPMILVAAGEYQAFFINQNKKVYGVGSNLRTLGVDSKGTPGSTIPVALPSTLTFNLVAACLHGGAAVDNKGNVWAWGDNDQGESGNGTTSTTGQLVPVQVTVDASGNTFTDVKALSSFFTGNVSVGWYAVKSDGTLWVWGQTLGGMAGNGTAGVATQTRPLQVPIPGNRQVMQVVGGTILIVLCTDGTVWTCGGTGGNAANLGYAATGNSYLSLVQLTSLSGITQIAGGGSFNYALQDNGTLYGWGDYGYYMGGTGGAGNNIPLAVPTDLTTRLALSQPIRSIVTSMVSTYVILKDSSLWAWGDNAQGTIGNGQELNYATTTDPYAWDFYPAELLVQTPVQVTTRTDFVAVFANQPFVFYAYAETLDGTLYSWGRNKGGVLGNGIIGCSNVSATYPNSWDVTDAKIVTPLTITKVTMEPSPYCIAHPTTAPCNSCPLSDSSFSTDPTITGGKTILPPIDTTNVGFGSIRVFPSVTTGALTLRIVSNRGGLVQIAIYNMMGKLVQMQWTTKTSGLLDVPLHVDQLTSGTYIVQVFIGEMRRLVTKFVRQ